MALIHTIKTWPEPFQAVAAGKKTHEIRRDDRMFAVGDVLVLHEWDPQTAEYTGEMTAVRVTYKTPGGAWGLPPWLCVLSVALMGT